MENRVVSVEELPLLLQSEDANRWTVQYFSVGTGWMDYASIKDQSDLDHARRLLHISSNYRIFGRI